MYDLRANHPFVQLAAVIAAAVVPAYLVFVRSLQRYLLRQCTAMVDLERLGRPRQGGKLPGTAVICGASFAGLMAARVCSDHFERVIVVEPDAWALSDDARTGKLVTGTRSVVSSSSGVEYNVLTHNRARIMQYVAPHVYQVFLLRFLRKLFPGFDNFAKERGIIFGPSDFRIRANGVQLGYPYAEYAARGEDLPQTIFSSRRMLESLLRWLVHRLCPDIEYIDGTAVGFSLVDDGASVASVNVRLANGVQHDIPCGMVIDCTGNTQAGFKLLGRALPLPPRLRADYNPQLNLSALDVPTPPGWNDAHEEMRTEFAHSLCAVPMHDIGMYFSWVVDPEIDHRTFIVLRSEAGVIVGSYGWESEMGVSLEQLREYSRQLVGELPPPEYIPKMLDLLAPVADQGTAFELRVNSCSRIFYENAHTVLPRNFVALGDATMRLNPRLGEGVTKAAVGAATLDGVLRDCRGGPGNRAFGNTFFRRLADRTSSLWETTKAVDYGAETTVPVAGETRASGAFNRWYIGRLMRAAAYDATLSSTFWHVSNYLAPAALLSTPRAIITVLWHTVFPAPPI